MEIRIANENDMENIAQLYINNWKEIYRGLLSDDFLNRLNIYDATVKWKNYLSHEDHLIFVAYENEIFLGFTACNEDYEINQCLYLSTLHVVKNARGHGVGSKLIYQVGQFAYLKGYKKMSICIVKGNDKAKNLYEKIGARHYKDFIDKFDNIKSNSEKLIWNDLSNFQNHSLV